MDAPASLWFMDVSRGEPFGVRRDFAFWGEGRGPIVGIMCVLRKERWVACWAAV